MKSALFGAACALSVAASTAYASSVTVNYVGDRDGTEYLGGLATGTDSFGRDFFSGPALNLGGVTVTGSANVYALELNGLGILGGNSDNTVDTNESILFTFNAGPAIDVSYRIASAGNTDGDNFVGERILEAFGAGGASLGTVTQSASLGIEPSDTVSSLFGGQAISAFSLTSPGVDNFRIWDVTYTTAPTSVVPLPAAGILLLGALGLMAGLARRRSA